MFLLLNRRSSILANHLLVFCSLSLYQGRLKFSLRLHNCWIRGDNFDRALLALLIWTLLLLDLICIKLSSLLHFFLYLYNIACALYNIICCGFSLFISSPLVINLRNLLRCLVLCNHPCILARRRHIRLISYVEALLIRWLGIYNYSLGFPLHIFVVLVGVLWLLEFSFLLRLGEHWFHTVFIVDEVAVVKVKTAWILIDQSLHRWPRQVLFETVKCIFDTAGHLSLHFTEASSSGVTHLLPGLDSGRPLLRDVGCLIVASMAVRKRINRLPLLHEHTAL